MKNSTIFFLPNSQVTIQILRFSFLLDLNLSTESFKEPNFIEMEIYILKEKSNLNQFILYKE